MFTEILEFLNVVVMNFMLRSVLAHCTSSLTAGLIKLTKLFLNTRVVLSVLTESRQ